MFGRRESRSENIMILGLGGVGYYLTRRLAHDGHAITAVEMNPSLIRRADSEVDARLIRGDALKARCWKEAHAESMDYLIAVTNNDAVNMLSSLIGDRFGIERKIARIRSLDLGSGSSILSARDMKVDLVIHPEELTAQEVVRLVKLRAGNTILDLADGEVQVMATRVPETSPLAHRTLSEIARTYHDHPFRIVSIARGITTIIPGGDLEILPQDQVFILAGKEHLPWLMDLTGVETQAHHRVMILGGGLVGSRVAELLSGQFEVRLIEKDEKRAEELSHILDRAEIFHGDGSNADTLSQAGILDMDTVITATRENETNIMSCLLAKHLMCDQGGASSGRQGKTIALVNKEEYLVLAATMGADVALNKKVLAGNEILKYIRRGELLSVAHLHGFDAEVVEIVARDKAAITRRPLHQITDLKGSAVIGSVFQGGAWRIAVGSTHIRAGDRAIVICSSDALKDVQRLFLD